MPRRQQWLRHRPRRIRQLAPPDTHRDALPSRENGQDSAEAFDLGLYQPTKGRILIDGTDLRTLDLVARRRCLSGAFQDFFMFEYPVQRSVGVGDLPNIDSAEHVNAAVRRAGADRLVKELPKGLETQIGVTWQSGVGLSHGQWQRIALARAYMRRTSWWWFSTSLRLHWMPRQNTPSSTDMPRQPEKINASIRAGLRFWCHTDSPPSRWRI